MSKVLTVTSLENLPPVEPRQPMPLADEQARLDPAQEAELGFDQQAVQAEAKRCLNCGLLCYYRSSYH